MLTAAPACAASFAAAAPMPRLPPAMKMWDSLKEFIVSSGLNFLIINPARLSAHEHALPRRGAFQNLRREKFRTGDRIAGLPARAFGIMDLDHIAPAIAAVPRRPVP